MPDKHPDCAQCPLTGHACLTTVTLEKHLDQRLADMEKATQLLAVSAARERDGHFVATALADDTFRESVLTWTNTTDATKTILLRFLAQAASGSAWSEFEYSFDRSIQGVHGAY